MPNSLTPRDKQLIKREFNEGGYVLDFNNASFASFTLSSVGISIQDKYGLSKGGSLEQFFEEANDELCEKLLNDLIQKRRDMDLFGDAEISSNEEESWQNASKLRKGYPLQRM